MSFARVKLRDTGSAGQSEASKVVKPSNPCLPAFTFARPCTMPPRPRPAACAVQPAHDESCWALAFETPVSVFSSALTGSFRFQSGLQIMPRCVCPLVVVLAIGPVQGMQQPHAHTSSASCKTISVGMTLESTTSSRQHMVRQYHDAGRHRSIHCCLSAPLPQYIAASVHCCLSALLPQCIAASVHCCLSALLPQYIAASVHCCLSTLLP